MVSGGCCPVGLLDAEPPALWAVPEASTWTRVAPLHRRAGACRSGLDAGLADLVARLERPVARLLELVRIHLAHVAEEVGGQRALRVARARRRGRRVTPGKRRLVLAQEVDELVGDVALQGHRAGRRAPWSAGGSPCRSPRRSCPAPRRGAAITSRAPLRATPGSSVGSHLERERGAVADQRLAVAVEDLAARRLDGDLAHLVVVGLGQVAVAREHLGTRGGRRYAKKIRRRSAPRIATRRWNCAGLSPPRQSPRPNIRPCLHGRDGGAPPIRDAPPRRRARRRRRETERRRAGAASSTRAGRRMRRSSGIDRHREEEREEPLTTISRSTSRLTSVSTPA